MRHVGALLVQILFAFVSLFSRIQGDCGSLPKLSNAVPYKKVDAERFRPMESVTYKCLSGFYNVHGKLDVVTCLPDSNWSPIEEFCERVCTRPSRFKFARAKAEDIKPYHTAKTRVTYVCRPGYNTIPGINSVITCLENYTWSALPVFCEGKSCGNPGKPENGEAVILTNLLYLAKVNFICEEGYRLIGLSSTQCVLKGDRVQWQSKPPECQRQTGPTIRPTSKKITISPKTGQTQPTVRLTSQKITNNPKAGSTQSPGTTAPKKEPGTRNTTGIVVGAVIGVLILAAAIAVFMKCRSCYRERTL